MPDRKPRELTDLEHAYRKELIEIAAVAISAIEDLDYGEADHRRFLGWHDPYTENPAFRDVWEERIRQDSKWGPQTHDPRAWLTILGEEFGEACQAALRIKHEMVREFDLGA